MRKLLGALFSLLMVTGVSAGDLEGTVEIHSRLGRRPIGKLQRHPGQNNGPLYQAPAKVSAAVDEVSNVVIFLLDTPGGPNKPVHTKMNQKNRQFSPYVLPIVRDSTVDFVNGDGIFHSVYSQCECAPFHLPEFPQGESRSIHFPQPGDVELFCAIHPEMNAHILVLDTGFFVTPDENHKFKLEDVPAGRRVLKAWHPRLRNPVTKIIDVPPSGSLHIDLAL
ncbi:MAG: hypothetical protein J0I12_15305 [Candidatus Eremiobacteraeota bacterium]|nr:hypothetical protein [Candidatus Eremiobacteraeota bacterium]